MTQHHERLHIVPDKPPLRIAIITQQNVIDAWHAVAFDRLQRDVAHIVLRVDVDRISNVDERSCGLRRDGHARMWRIYRQFRLERRGRALERRSADAAMQDVPVVRTRLDRHGVAGLALSKQAVDRIERARCDVVVNLTDYRICGPPATAPYGVWEYRVSLGNDDALQAQLTSATAPALFELSLVRIADECEPTTVLQRGWIYGVPRSLAASIDAAYFTTCEWLNATCRAIVTGQSPDAGGSPREPMPLDDPTLLRVVAGSPWRWLRWGLRQLVWQEEWHIGVVDQPLEQLFRTQQLGHPHWLDTPSDRHYLADPFGCMGSDTVLVEDFDYLTRRGSIAAVKISNADLSTVTRTVLETDGHMSYPYLLEWDGDVYCIPESSDQRRAVLYRADPFPDMWKQVAVLVEGLAVTDPTIVRHNGRWWLFCTDGQLGPGSNLHIYHADKLTGPWQPHIGNPVKIDIRSARPAGTPFMVDGALIRPAQENTMGYGSGVVFNRIEQLSPHMFRERPVARLEPMMGSPYRHGLHTVSAWGDRTLIDGKRKGPSLTNLIGRVLSRIR